MNSFVDSLALLPDNNPLTFKMTRYALFKSLDEFKTTSEHSPYTLMFKSQFFLQVKKHHSMQAS